MTTSFPRSIRPRLAPGVALAGALLLLTATQASAQCAMCRDSAAAAPTATREALNYAIIGLAFTPYGVAAAAAWALSPAFRSRIRGGLKRLRLSSREESA